MKIFLLLSDINQGLIIGGIITAVITPLMAVGVAFLNRLIIKTELIHKEIDGMKGELVEATKLLGEAVGKAQGRAELRQELEDKTDAPAEVIIKENLDKEVIIKKNLDK